MKIDNLFFIKVKYRISRFLAFLPWLIFRSKNRLLQVEELQLSNEDVSFLLRQKEKHVHSLLNLSSSKSFLEIGIGEFPIVSRIQLMNEKNIEYTACDFVSVCETHKRVLQSEGLLKENLHYKGNATGTYAYTLFDLLNQGKKYDIIYIDGHHTFYIDFPAFILAHHLLNPNGYILIDDIEWSLHFMKNLMKRKFDMYFFYHKIYDFSQYEENQQKEKHMKLIAEDILIKQYNYVLNKEYSFKEWWVLQRQD